MTRITPLRLMILQFSQSFLTDARTFMFQIFRRSLNQNPARGHVERRQFQSHFIPVGHSRRLRPLPSARVRHKAMAIGQFRPEQPFAEHFYYCAFNDDGVFAWHVRISGSAPVTRTVCSKWAES